MFDALKQYFDGCKDDVVVIHSHKFLNKDSNNEKDFIILNLTKGYILVIEVKANQSKYQKAKKQLFDAKDRFGEIFGALGFPAGWKYGGVFFAQFNESDKQLFDCDACSKFAIIGTENIPESLRQIEKEIMKSHGTPNQWEPEDHVQEFVDLIKELMFIAQGDPYAPVTESSLINKIAKHVKDASSFENIFFWTLDQLSVIQALLIRYLFLDAFYSTGKSVILKCIAKHWIKEKKIVHYFIHRLGLGHDIQSKLPFTLMLEYEFKDIKVKIRETAFKFGKDSPKKFLKENGVEPDHFVCFDEVICEKYDNRFLRCLNQLKENVSGLWVALGAKPVAEPFSVNILEQSEFVCPRLNFPLRNPLEIAKNAHKVTQDGAKNLQIRNLANNIDITEDTNIVQGKLVRIVDENLSYQEAISKSLQEIPPGKKAMVFIDGIQLTEAEIKEMFSDQERALPYLGSEDELKLQKWLCDPKGRKNDLCLASPYFQCNGIECEIIVYILPGPCPKCEFSSQDPVISSRATAMLILATYQGSSCPNPNCGNLNLDDEEDDYDDEENNDTDGHLDVTETETKETNVHGNEENYNIDGHPDVTEAEITKPNVNSKVDYRQMGAIPKRRPLNLNSQDPKSTNQEHLHLQQALQDECNLTYHSLRSTVDEQFEDNPDRLPKEVSSQSKKPNSNLDLGKF